VKKQIHTHDAHDQSLLPAETLEGTLDGDTGVAPLYRGLRKMILNGVFPPGSTFSQVKLAESLGVSRIPLREALRMLQKEGLVEAEHNHRARVPAFEPATVDALYASRILLEALSIRLTVPALTPEDVHAIEYTLTALDQAAGHEDLDEWEEPHRRFHRLLVIHAGAAMRDGIAVYADQCEYYRRLYYRLMNGQAPTRPAQVIAAEHLAIADECLQGHADRAAHLLARHYARTALTVLGEMTPEFDPVAVRMALQVVGADAPLAVPRERVRRQRKGAEAHTNDA